MTSSTSRPINNWIPRNVVNNPIAKDYYSYKQQYREDRIRYFDVVFYNTETRQRIPPHLRHQHDNIASKPTNNTVRSLKDLSFIRRRKIQRLILHKRWLNNQWKIQEPDFDKMIQEAK